MSLIEASDEIVCVVVVCGFNWGYLWDLFVCAVCVCLCVCVWCVCVCGCVVCVCVCVCVDVLCVCMCVCVCVSDVLNVCVCFFKYMCQCGLSRLHTSTGEILVYRGAAFVTVLAALYVWRIRVMYMCCTVLYTVGSPVGRMDQGCFVDLCVWCLYRPIGKFHFCVCMHFMDVLRCHYLMSTIKCMICCVCACVCVCL